MALLTDRTLAASSVITASTLIHIVDVNDFSQNPAGSSYKANLGQLSSFFSGSTFTGGSGNCITDFYVTNIHGCSPIHIQPTSPDDVYLVEGGGNIGIGLTSASTKLHVSGDTLVNSNNVMLSNSLTSIPVSNFKGFISYFDTINNSGYNSYNTNSSGSTSYSSLNDNGVFTQVLTFGSDYIKPSAGLVGSNFYKNKTVIRSGPDGSSEGLVINPLTNNPSATLWFEIDGSSAMILKGDGVGGSGNAYLGLALNPDGTEMPTSNLQIGGAGTTGTFQYKDGNQSSGYILTSDIDGNANWGPLSSLSGSSVISVTGVTTSAYTATTSYSYYGVEYSGNTNIEIPDATGLDGFTFRIKDERGTSATYPITITPVTGNIDNNNYIDIQINYMSLTLVARNNNWWII